MSLFRKRLRGFLWRVLEAAGTLAGIGHALAASPISVAIGPAGYKHFVTGDAYFRPIGVNYLMEHYGAPYKTFDMFGTHTFDISVIDSNLKSISEDGFTFVRLWLKGLDPDAGFNMNSPQIGEAYAENLLATMQHARRYGLRVVLTGAFHPGQWVPRNYQPLQPLPDETVAAGMNRLILIPELAQATGAFFGDLLRWLRTKDPTILSTVFYIDLYNELHFELDKAPFNRESGYYVFLQRDYDLSVSSSRQDLMDRATEAWLREVGGRVRSVDSHLLVTASTSLVTAFGHSDFDGGSLHKTAGQLTAYPIRPKAIIQAGMDLVDIHIYPSPSHDSIRAFHERAKAMLQESDVTEDTARNLPLIVGELGAGRDKFADPGAGAEELLATAQVLCQLHFTGFAIWAWNGTGDTWTLDDLPLMHAMGPKFHPEACTPRP